MFCILVGYIEGALPSPSSDALSAGVMFSLSPISIDGKRSGQTVSCRISHASSGAVSIPGDSSEPVVVTGSLDVGQGGQQSGQICLEVASIAPAAEGHALDVSAVLARSDIPAQGPAPLVPPPEGAAQRTQGVAPAGNRMVDRDESEIWF